jgi:hypothetical protein
MPLYPDRGWASMHSLWSGEIVAALNGSLLPECYYAETEVHIKCTVSPAFTAELRPLVRTPRSVPPRPSPSRSPDPVPTAAVSAGAPAACHQVTASSAVQRPATAHSSNSRSSAAASVGRAAGAFARQRRIRASSPGATARPSRAGGRRPWVAPGDAADGGARRAAEGRQGAVGLGCFMHESRSRGGSGPRLFYGPSKRRRQGQSAVIPLCPGRTTPAAPRGRT